MGECDKKISLKNNNYIIYFGILADEMAKKKGGFIGKYRGFRRDAKYMIMAGQVEHLSYALNGFVLVLYLNVLGYSNVLFGTLALVMEISHVIVLLCSGFLADRFSRRRMLLFAASFGTAGIMIFAFSESVNLFFVAAVLMGVGSGFWGPAYSALLAEKTNSKRRSYLFSLNSMMGHLGSGSITLVGGFIPLLFMSQFRFQPANAYRMIFMLALIMMFVGMFLIYQLKKDKPRRAEKEAEIDTRKAWPLIIKFAIPTAFTGLGAGLLVPYFPIYFKLRFELEIESIGIIFALLAYIMVMMTIYLPRLAEKRGTVLTTTLFHLSAICAMISMPFTPWLSIVVFLFIFRAAMMNVPGPIMTSFMMGNITREIRATALSAVAFSWMVPHAVGIFIGGFIWDMDPTLRLPFYISTVLYVVSIVIYIAYFYKMDDKKHAPIFYRQRLQNK